MGKKESEGWLEAAAEGVRRGEKDGVDLVMGNAAEAILDEEKGKNK